MKKIGQTLLLLGMAVKTMAQESSSLESSASSYLSLPDSLTDEMITAAKEGFSMGFGISTAFIVAGGGIVLFMHLINRGAGR